MFRVHDSQMSREGVISAKSLLLSTQRTVHLELPGVVNGVLVPREIVRPGEDCVARLSGGRIDPLTFVGTRLRVSLGR